MATDDYHKNDFLLKTMSAFRIVVGVAVTLAVLFTMVWLIDYSSDRPVSSYNQQTLLLPGDGENKKPQQEQTFFEALLNNNSEKKEEVVGGLKKVPDSKPPAGFSQRSPAVEKPESPPVVRRAEPPVAVTRNQPSQSTPRPAILSPLAKGAFTVQLGSFQQDERARIFSENLAAKGYQPYITKNTMPDGTITYRVRIGRFATREEAISFASRIESKEKISVFVTSM